MATFQKGDLIRDIHKGYANRLLKVTIKPEWQPGCGGMIMGVTYASTDDIVPEGILPDGSIHPAHAPGFEWIVSCRNMEHSS